MTIDTILTECKQKGLVVLVKTTNREIREVILEAEGRGYLYKSQAGVYRLTPAGYGFLDELERSECLLRSQTANNVARNNKIDKIKITIGFIKSKPFIELSIVEIITIALTLIGVLLAILQFTVGLF